MSIFFRTRGRLTDESQGYVPPRRRVRTPTVLQMEAVECGAAALSIVLAYYGRLVALEELRLACGVSRDGSKASNILKAARRYGLEGKGYRRDPEKLEDLALPLIVHWNFNHFLVLEGFGRGVAYLNDPAMGPREVSLEEFDQGFTGVALALRPAPEFARGGHRPSLVGALRRRLAGSAGALAFVILAGLLLIVPGLVVPSFTRIFVDNVLVRGLDDWVRPLLVVMGVAALVLAALTWLQQHYLLRLETRLALSASCKFFWHVLHLPAQFFAQRFAGEIGNRVGLSDRIAALLSGELATTTLNLVLIGFYATLMVQYDLVLTAIGVGAALLNLAALRYVSRRRTDLNQRLRQDHGKLMGVAFSGLQTIETLKATGGESDFFARWAGHHAKVVDAQQRLSVETQLLSAVPPLLLAITTALLLGIGGLRVMEGHLSMGMLIAFQALMLGFMLPVNRMVDLGSTLQEVRGDMTRLDDVLRAERAAGLELVSTEAPPDGAARDDAAAGGGPLVKLSGQLELRDVSFGYNPLDPPLLKSFSLSVTPGSRVAIVGSSGCGKSTLAKLVCGLYEPWTGEILFDGRPRREISRSVLANSVALVDQSIFLFEGSVRDNVTLWDNTISESTVGSALTGAAIVEDVVTRPGGFAARVEEGGRNFSGGQRQRLEIARALAAEPSILVLDEATSALDTHTEQLIDDAIRRRGVTCLIIAHRLSTIRDCDQIIVLEKGEVVQRGTHEQLRDVPGPYSRLIATE